jgi:hypothetical protein
MKLERRGRGETAPALGVWAGCLLLLGLGVSALWFRLGLPLPGCAFRELTGLPCATCGSTRMVQALLSGDLLQAIAWNPLVFVALASLSVWSLWAILSLAFDLPRWRLVSDRRERRVLGALAIAFVLAGWTCLIVRGV